MMLLRQCRICANSESLVPHRFREMMFGTRDEFDYVECPACGCLQAVELQVDTARLLPRKLLFVCVSAFR